MGNPAKLEVDQDRIVVPRPPGSPRVLSSGQFGLWYLSQLSPTAYNVPFYHRLRGPLNVEILEGALNAIVGRHEVLRTLILSPYGHPVPVRLSNWKLKLKRVDLRAVAPFEREATAMQVVTEESSRSFNLARDLLLRGTVIQIADDDFIFLHDVPHLAFDGNSVSILLSEISAFYNSILCGTRPQLPELTVQYADFAAWQQQFLQGERLNRLTRYWSERLRDCPTVTLPVRYARPKVHSMRGARTYFVFPPELLKRASEFFHFVHTTPYRGLCACFFVFLNAYTGQGDLSVGSPFRPRCTGIENLIGFFVNTVVLRVQLLGEWNFYRIIEQVDSVVKAAMQNSDITFDKLMLAAKPNRDPSRHPLFQVNFRAPKRPYPSLELAGMTADPAKYVDNNTSKFDLALEIETCLGQSCYFEYYSELFAPSAVGQMVVDFMQLLESLITNPGVPIRELEIVRAIRERHRPEARRE